MAPDGPKLLRAFQAEDDPVIAKLAKFSLYADRFKQSTTTIGSPLKQFESAS